MARWGPRDETASAVADRLVKFLRAASRVHPMFRNWHVAHKAGRERLATSRPDALAAVIERSRNREEVPPYRPIRDLGFRCTAYSEPAAADVRAGRSRACMLGVSAGATTALGNSVQLDSVVGSPLLPDLQTAAALIRAFVNAWDPEWVGLISTEFDAVFRGREPSEVQLDAQTPQVGWLLYLRGRRLTPTDVPSAADVRPIGDAGSLIIVRPEPVDIGDPAQYETTERVRHELGLLHPFVPSPRAWASRVQARNRASRS